MNEIESGVPLPKKRGAYNKEAEKTMDKMSVGDSVLVDRGGRLALYRAAKKRGYEITTRTEGDSYRVWRTK